MDDIRIDRLTLKLSGISEAEGRRLAQLVAEALAAADLPEGAAASPSSLHVRVDSSGGSLAAMSQEVVAEIMRQLVV